MARVKKGSFFGFIDCTGKVVIPMSFINLSRFSDGLAVAAEPEGLGYIDKTGVMVILPRFEEAKEFKNGLAAVFVDNQWQVIDKLGKTIVRFPAIPEDRRQKMRIIWDNSDWGQRAGWTARAPKVKEVPDIFTLFALAYWDSRVTYYPRQKRLQIEEKYATADGKIQTASYFYDIAGNKVPHFVNYMSDGNLALWQEKYQEAITSYSKALEINPGDRMALWGIEQARRMQANPTSTNL